MSSIVTTDTWEGWFDGACWPNPGPMGLGAVLVGPGNQYHDKFINAGIGTINQAEWQALILLLETALSMGITRLLVRGDSQLVIKQVNREWRVSETFVKHYLMAHKLISQFQRVKFIWVPREDNGLATMVASRAFRESTHA